MRARRHLGLGSAAPLGAVLLAAAWALSSSACGSESEVARESAAGPDAGGGPSEWQGLPGARLEPLAAAKSARTASFMTSDECAFCHAAEPGSGALLDAKGRDVSPFASWRGSMMALSARDPYYLAVLEHELAAHPGAESTVMSTCTRCHAPAANVELAAGGRALAYAELTHGTSNEATVGRDGVTCSLCHQIAPTGLGTSASFTGGYVTNDVRAIYGPHQAPFTMPMQQRVGYTPTAAAHMTESGLCGSCHTVVTRAVDAQGALTGPEVLEQGPFVEWSVSAFAKAGGASCQACHMPTVDDDGAAISTVLSTRPMNRLSARAPFGRHVFNGANAFMLRVLAREKAWAGFDTPAEDLLAQADRAEANLRSAARVTATVERGAEGLAVRVRIENLTGHKLPTAYPSRRMWLHVRVIDEAGAVAFESGAHRRGRIVDAAGAVLDAKDAVHVHRGEIASTSEVQIWEAVPGDARGKPATTLLDATGFLKDDRILPAGFDAADPRAVLARPVGVDADGDFVPGSDVVLVRVAPAPARGTVEIELLYQTTRPQELELLAEHPGPAALRFLDMLGPDALAPVVIARATQPLP